VKVIFTIFFFWLAMVSFAQRDTAFTLLRTYSGDISYVAIDNLDNLYIVSSTGQIKKLNNRGDSVAVFNGIRNYGLLHTLDVTNPLQPLLFYKDFSTVVVLDRLLSRRTALDLRKSGVLQPTAIGLSYDNNLWVFDQFDNKLKKLNEAGSVLAQTTDFRQLFDQTISPQRIINDGGFVYLADSAKGVYVFDNYGAFKRRVDQKGWRSIDVWDGKLVRLNGNSIVVYNPTTFTEQSRSFPTLFKPYLHSFTAHNKLLTFSKDSLRIYRFGF
jgi:hypothetical protein